MDALLNAGLVESASVLVRRPAGRLG